MTRNNRLRIRPLTVLDLPAVLELETCCFEDPWTAGMLQSSLESDRELWLAAESDGVPVGYVGSAFVLDEASLDRIAVRPDLRRNGIAAFLTASLFAELRARGIRLLMLEVRASNAAAIALYERFGFRRVGLRKNYYLSPPEDAVLMNAELTEKETEIPC